MTQSAQNAAVTGGELVTVTYQENLPDGSQKKESVFVRQIKTSELDAYINAQSNEVELVKLVTGRKAEWVDSLTVESVIEIIAVSERVNDPKASPLFSRRAERIKSLSSLIQKPTSQGQQASG